MRTNRSHAISPMKGSQPKFTQHLHTSLCDRFRFLVFAVTILLAGASASSFAQLQSIEEIDALFAEAMSALETDDLQTARRRFESILSANPGLHRARLKLARVYYLSLDYEKARQETLRGLQWQMA